MRTIIKWTVRWCHMPDDTRKRKNILCVPIRPSTVLTFDAWHLNLIRPHWPLKYNPGCLPPVTSSTTPFHRNPLEIGLSHFRRWRHTSVQKVKRQTLFNAFVGVGADGALKFFRKTYTRLTWPGSVISLAALLWTRLTLGVSLKAERMGS